MTPASRRTYALLLGADAGPDAELASEIALLETLDAVDEIHVWVSSRDVEAAGDQVTTNGWTKVAAVNAAHATRDGTVGAALSAIRPSARDEDLVLIADVERRSLTKSAASSCLSMAAEQGAAILASRVSGDVVHADPSCKIHWLPPQGLTFVADGLMASQFGRLFDLYDWATTVAAGSVNEPYRWSVARLQASVVISTDLGEPDPS